MNDIGSYEIRLTLKMYNFYITVMLRHKKSMISNDHVT